MKGIKFFLAFIAISFFSFVSAEYSTSTTTSSSEGYNTPIIDGSIIFEAKEDNGYVYTKWNSYTGDEKFKFYKIVRSTKVSNPVYPDNGYIKYSGDVNYNEFKDTKPEVGINYYRVCAMTYENNRYCSNVEKVEVKNTTMCTREFKPVCGYKNGIIKTYSNKCVMLSENASFKYMGKCTNTSISNTSESKLNSNIKIKSDQLVQKFIYSIDKKSLTNTQKIGFVNKIITKLTILKKSKEKLTDVIDYLILRLKEESQKYEDDFSDIEDIFKSIN